MENLHTFFDQIWSQTTLYRLGIAFGIILGALVVRTLAVYLLSHYVFRLTQLTDTDIDDLVIKALRRPLDAGIVLIGIYLAVQSYKPSPQVLEWTGTLFSALFLVLLAWLMLRLVNVLTYWLQGWAERVESPLADQLAPLIGQAARVLIGILAFLMIIQNMGYSISGLIATLGVGGLAVALAAQKTLSDFFGSIMLLIDRPFVVGDWIKSPDSGIEGTVERIGFRSTRIRTFEQTLITVPNSRLADFVTDNISRRGGRRVWITIGVTYDTKADQMREAVKRIKDILKEHSEVSKEFFLLVYFTDFGDHSLEIMVYYFTKTIAWADYLRIREDVNLKIMDALEEMGLSIAFPTRTVHLIDESDKDRNMRRSQQTEVIGTDTDTESLGSDLGSV